MIRSRACARRRLRLTRSKRSMRPAKPGVCPPARHRATESGASARSAPLASHAHRRRADNRRSARPALCSRSRTPTASPCGDPASAPATSLATARRHASTRRRLLANESRSSSPPSSTASGREPRLPRRADRCTTTVEALFADQIIESSEHVEWNEASESSPRRATPARRDRALRARDRARSRRRRARARRRRSSRADSIALPGRARSSSARIAFLHAIDSSDWPRSARMHARPTRCDWLHAGVLAGCARCADVDARRPDRRACWRARLDRSAAARRDRADTHRVPTGSRLPSITRDPPRRRWRCGSRSSSALTETPRVGRGRVALTLHLLSPAHRPVQVTRDLAGFWKNVVLRCAKGSARPISEDTPGRTTPPLPRRRGARSRADQ